MISTRDSLILGAVQGLTEFLPVSSSAHLALSQMLLGLQEVPLWYDILLHISTLLATLLVFRQEVKSLFLGFTRLPHFFKSLFQKGHLAIGDEPQSWLLTLITVTTLITGSLGLILKDHVEKAFSNLLMIGGSLITTGVLLTLAQWRIMQKGKSATHATLKDATLIGVAQGLAVFPGLSRSGLTLSTCLLRGFNRQLAGQYAFLISIPAVAGASLVGLKDGLGSTFEVSLLTCVAGLLTSFLAGYASLKLLIHWIHKGSLRLFAYYCWALGAFCLVMFLRG